MKTLPTFLSLLAALLLATGSSLDAQYNPPPPPDQQAPADQGAPPPDQQAPPPDQQQAPMDQDQGAPPPDDQDAPPPGQGAPDDQGAPADNGSGNADFQTFYNDLSSQGTWVQTNNYGYAWQPNVQDPNWSPYSNGHWVYTDEGWAWVADASEPWGWATYHYGRWVNLDGEGWAWVPGYTWAPAWVSWRYGGGYCGWAPLPPETFIGIDFGGGRDVFHIGGDCDTAYGIGPGYYNFIQVGYLGGRDYRGRYQNRNNNFAIIANTRNVTNVVVTNQRGAGRFGRVNAGGPDFATVNAQSRTPVQQARLSRSNRVGAASLSGNRLAVFAPRVNGAGTGTAFRPQSVGRTLNNVQVNRGTNISQPLAVNSRMRGSAPTSAQVQAAQTAQSHFGANSQIAAANARPAAAQTLSRPLNSYQPHNEARGASVRTNASINHSAANGVRPQNAFTGETAAPRTTGNAVNHTVNNAAVQNHVSPTHTSVTPANTQAEHAQTQRTEEEHAPVQHTTPQVQHTQVEHAPVQRTEEQRTPPEHREVQHAPVQQHVAPQHAPVQHAPAQHAAPQHSSGGGGKPANDDHH
jgi:hypothetical protein